MKQLLILMLLIFFISSCTESYDISRGELFGEWRTSEIYINGDDSEIPYNTNELIIMGLQESRYFYNFNGGEWTIDKDQLTLKMQNNIFRDYKVLFFNSDSLVVQANISKSLIFFDIESIEHDEIFELTEHFTRR